MSKITDLGAALDPQFEDEEKYDCYLKIDVWSRCVEAVEAKLREKNI